MATNEQIINFLINETVEKDRTINMLNKTFNYKNKRIIQLEEIISEGKKENEKQREEIVKLRKEISEYKK